MEYRRLGDSGLVVSRIALGCMSFGDTSRGFSEWSLGDEQAQPFFEQALIHRRTARLDEVRVHARSVQPDAT